MLKKGRYVSVPLEEVEPAPVKREDGWRDMDMRFILGSKFGIENVCVFRAIFAPGAAHEKHIHPNSDEFSYIVRGRALLGFDDQEEQEVGAGNVRFIPAGTVHWLRGLGEEVEVVGAYLGVGTLEEAGYQFIAHVE